MKEAIVSRRIVLNFGWILSRIRKVQKYANEVANKENCVSDIRLHSDTYMFNINESKKKATSSLSMQLATYTWDIILHGHSPVTAQLNDPLA